MILDSLLGPMKDACGNGIIIMLFVFVGIGLIRYFRKRRQHK